MDASTRQNYERATQTARNGFLRRDQACPVSLVPSMHLTGKHICPTSSHHVVCVLKMVPLKGHFLVYCFSFSTSIVFYTLTCIFADHTKCFYSPKGNGEISYSILMSVSSRLKISFIRMPKYQN